MSILKSDVTRLTTEGLRTLCGGPFSFSVDRGECAAFSGPSGCGKTLFLRALADLDPAEGAVSLDGTDRSEMSAPQWRRRVGWQPAESSWWFDRVGDHFRRVAVVEAMAGTQRSEASGGRESIPAFGHPSQGGEHSRSGTSIRGLDLKTLQKLGFEEDVLGWRVDRMSTGEKQRLALFRLLLNGPQVLLLDEPTAALDRTNVHLAEEVIAEFRNSTGAAVLWISHDPEQVERVADRHFKFAGSGLEAVR